MLQTLKASKKKKKEENTNNSAHINFDNLYVKWTNEMNQCLEKHKLSQHTQYEIDNLNSLVTIKKSEFMVLKLLPQKTIGPDGLTGEFYKTFKELTTILHNLFQNIEEEGTFPNSFYVANITLIQKSDRQYKKIKL